ncbi:MAG: glycosyltransferase 87 family protein [Steroidobacteraceae bacterium]
MTTAGMAPGVASEEANPAAGIAGITAAHRMSIYCAFTVAVLVINYLLGKDMAPDTLNYHLYAGFSAVHNRFSQDYFAAGPSSYLNPYIYAPFYALVSIGLSALAISSLLTIMQSAILWLTFEAAVLVCPVNDRRILIALGVCAAALALANPILLQQIGSCFADITTAELVLLGWLLLARAIRMPHWRGVVFAGLILGTATALKLTNAVHAAAGFAVVAMLPLMLRQRIRYSLAYGAALAAGFVAVSAPWSYRLEKTFGNPLFPFLNNVFRSPEFTTEPLRHFRFIPGTFGAALWRPFAIMDPVNMVHEELRAPDLRYAVLIVLGIVGLLLWFWRRRDHHSTRSWDARTMGAGRVLAALSLGLAVDWVAWLRESGNGRYFMPMACVTAVVAIGLIFRIFSKWPKARNYVLVAIFSIQAVQLCMGTEYRWNGVPWGGPWFDVEVPARLRVEPNLYLTIGIDSNSFIAPFLAGGAGLINFSGGYALGGKGANGARIDALIHRYSPHVRVLIEGLRLYEDRETGDPKRSQVDEALERFGLRVDPQQCATIAVHGLPRGIPITLQGEKPALLGPPDTTDFVTCHVVADHRDHSIEVTQRRAADLVLDRLEDACPQLFQPRRPLTEHDGRAWMRRYLNTDVTAWVSNGGVKILQAIRGSGPIYLGRETDWEKKPKLLSCGRRSEKYYAKDVAASGT